MEKWQQFSGSRTLELINIYQDATDADSNRDAAFIALCFRFRKDVLDKCEALCRRFKHSAELAEKITDSTFEKYGKKPGFNIEKSNTTDVDTAFKLYLYTIAQRELTNHYRKEKRRANGYDYTGDEKIITELPSIPIDRLDIKTKVKHQAIMSLPPSHRTVYLTYEFYERKGFNLPKHLRVQLREHLGVKQNTIRTYKKEAKDRIQSYLNALEITQNFNN